MFCKLQSNPKIERSCTPGLLNGWIMNDLKSKLFFLTYIIVSIGLSETVTIDEIPFSFFAL